MEAGTCRLVCASPASVTRRPLVGVGSAAGDKPRAALAIQVAREGFQEVSGGYSGAMKWVRAAQLGGVCLMHAPHSMLRIRLPESEVIFGRAKPTLFARLFNYFATHDLDIVQNR